MVWQRLILLLLILLGVPAAYLFLVVYLDLIHPKSTYEWLGLALLYYGGWLAVAFAYFQAWPTMREFLLKPQDAEAQRLEFPYQIFRPSELYTSLTTLSHSNLPYVTRVGDSDYEDLAHTMRQSGNLMILGREGIGKTREAIEFIRRLETELGEDISVLIPKGSVEIPQHIDINKLGRNIVLLIDDLPAHSVTPYRTFEPNDPKLLDSFRQRIEQTLQLFSNIYGQRFRVIATAKGDTEFQDRIDLTDPLWRQFTIIDLPDLSFDRRYQFLQSAEVFFCINISIAAKLELQKRSDGTFSGLIFPLVQEKSRERKRINLEDIEKYECTYPDDWEQQVFRREFLPNIYRKNILSALSIFPTYIAGEYGENFLGLQIGYG